MRTTIFTSAWIAILAITASSCRKPFPLSPPPEPGILLTEMNDTVVAFQGQASFDLDRNGTRDLTFSTLEVSDPATMSTGKRWVVTASTRTHLPLNEQEALPMLRASELIPVVSFPGYNWYNARQVILAELRPGSPIPWRNNFQNANHQIIAIRLERDGRMYNGWVDVSFRKAQERLVLHRAGVCLEPDTPIIAGR